jgi:hypothetical protein
MYAETNREASPRGRERIAVLGSAESLAEVCVEGEKKTPKGRKRRAKRRKKKNLNEPGKL